MGMNDRIFSSIFKSDYIKVNSIGGISNLIKFIRYYPSISTTIPLHLFLMPHSEACQSTAKTFALKLEFHAKIIKSTLL